MGDDTVEASAALAKWRCGCGSLGRHPHLRRVAPFGASPPSRRTFRAKPRGNRPAPRSVHSPAQDGPGDSPRARCTPAPHGRRNAAPADSIVLAAAWRSNVAQALCTNPLEDHHERAGTTADDDTGLDLDRLDAALEMLTTSEPRAARGAAPLPGRYDHRGNSRRSRCIARHGEARLDLRWGLAGRGHRRRSVLPADQPRTRRPGRRRSLNLIRFWRLCAHVWEQRDRRGVAVLASDARGFTMQGLSDSGAHV